MHNRLILTFFITTFATSSIFSQYTEMINTNRPGGSQGAFAVGKNVLQFEAGMSLGKEEHSLLKTETNGLNIDYAIRYGFWKERLELSFTGEFQSNNITYTNFQPEIESKVSNFKSNTFGAKYLLYDPYRKRELAGPNLYSWKKNNRFQVEDLIPAIALYVGANFDYIDDEVVNPFIPPSDNIVSPKFVLATQNNWIGGWVFVTNIIVDRVTTDYPSYGYILTLTHATNRYFSVFVENQGFKSDFYSDQLLRGGAAVLVNNNFHVDLSLAYGFKDTPSIFYGRVGIAYRLDMHKEDEYLEDEGNEMLKTLKGKDSKKDKKAKRIDELDPENTGEK